MAFHSKSAALADIARVAFVVMSCLSAAAAQQPVQVMLDDGPYSGVTMAGVNKFLGVRYAAPPERFAPPAPASMTPHSDAKDATKFAPSCIQAIPGKVPLWKGSQHFTNSKTAPIAAQMGNMGPQSEDCLFVNVFAPSSPPPPEGRTVMVWYYGGGFQFGSANTTMFDGSSFAQNQDVIVVTPNYRTSG